MDLFKEKINASVSISKTEMNKVLAAFTCVKINKGKNLIEKNTYCNNYYFLEKGLLRFIYHVKDKEETSWVIFEGVFFTEIMSLKSGEKTNMSLVALEPSLVFSIDKLKLEKLCEEIKSFEKFLRLTWEENLYHVIRMKLLQQFSSAKERYEMLRKDSKLMQRIPQKYLASILGITPYSLSRIRSGKKS